MNRHFLHDPWPELKHFLHYLDQYWLQIDDQDWHLWTPALMHRLEELHDVMGLLATYQGMVDTLFQDMPRLVQFWRGLENNEKNGWRLRGGEVRRFTVHSNLQDSLLQLPLPVRSEGVVIFRNHYTGRREFPRWRQERQLLLRTCNMHPHLDFRSLQALRLVNPEFEDDSWVAFLLEAEVNLYEQREKMKIWIAARSNDEGLHPFWHPLENMKMNGLWTLYQRRHYDGSPTLEGEDCAMCQYWYAMCQYYSINYRYPLIDLDDEGVDQVGRLLHEGFSLSMTLIWSDEDTEDEDEEEEEEDSEDEEEDPDEEDPEDEEEDPEDEEEDPDEEDPSMGYMLAVYHRLQAQHAARVASTSLERIEDEEEEAEDEDEEEEEEGEEARSVDEGPPGVGRCEDEGPPSAGSVEACALYMQKPAETHLRRHFQPNMRGELLPELDPPVMPHVASAQEDEEERKPECQALICHDEDTEDEDEEEEDSEDEEGEDTEDSFEEDPIAVYGMIQRVEKKIQLKKIQRMRKEIQRMRKNIQRMRKEIQRMRKKIQKTTVAATAAPQDITWEFLARLCVYGNQRDRPRRR